MPTPEALQNFELIWAPSLKPWEAPLRCLGSRKPDLDGMTWMLSPYQINPPLRIILVVQSDLSYPLTMFRGYIAAKLHMCVP